MALEYPLGTVVGLFSWGGADTGLIPAGANLLSDSKAVSIPAGAWFALRVYAINSSAGLPFTQIATGATVMAGEGVESGTSGITDKTLAGTIPAAGTSGLLYPTAIVAMTTKPSALIIGDSRIGGQTGTPDALGNTGEAARSIGALIPVVNAGVPADQAQFRGRVGYLNRYLSKYVSFVVNELGAKDIDVGNSVAQASAALHDLYAMFPAKPIVQTSFTPITSSTDSWATTVNQARFAGQDNQDTLQAQLAAKPAPIQAFVDHAVAVKSGGVWAAGKTNDGRHANNAGYDAIVAAAAFNVSSLAAITATSNLWTPHELEFFDRLVWVETNDVLLATADGSAWYPKSRSASLAQATSTKRPALTPSTMNGKDAYVFDGVDDFLSSATYAALSGGVNVVTTFAAFKYAAGLTGNGFVTSLSQDTSNTAARAALTINGTSGFIQATGRRVAADASTVQSSTTTLVDGSVYIAMVEVNAAAGTVRLRINGAFEGGTGTLATTGTFGPAGLAFAVGANGAGSSPFKGAIGAVAHFNGRALTQGEIERVEGYLGPKFGATLVAGHPYKNTAPVVL